MALREDENCSNCKDEDTDNDEYPCNRCNPVILNEWNPKLEEGTDLWDM